MHARTRAEIAQAAGEMCIHPQLVGERRWLARWAMEMEMGEGGGVEEARGDEALGWGAALVVVRGLLLRGWGGAFFLGWRWRALDVIACDVSKRKRFDFWLVLFVGSLV